MAAVVSLSLDDLLTTTRAVRKRLNCSRPVERHLLEVCLTMAMQAPTASHMQHWQGVVVRDAATRAALAAVCRKGREQDHTAPRLTCADPLHPAMQARVTDSAMDLAAPMHEVPLLVVPCLVGQTDGHAIMVQSTLWGTIATAMWNCMLAARAQRLGTCWTCVHLLYDREAAEVLEIPSHEVMQVERIPVAYTHGTTLPLGWRKPLDTTVRWDTLVGMRQREEAHDACARCVTRPAA
jgi:nitroreductase